MKTNELPTQVQTCTILTSCELNCFRAALVPQLKLLGDVWGSSGAPPGAAAAPGSTATIRCSDGHPSTSPFPLRSLPFLPNIMPIPLADSSELRHLPAYCLFLSARDCTSHFHYRFNTTFHFSYLTLKSLRLWICEPLQLLRMPSVSRFLIRVTMPLF